MATQEAIRGEISHREPRSRPDQAENGNTERLARALGWFSIGLGVAEVVAPRRLSRFVGVTDDYPQLIRAFGLREIVSGIGILSQPKPAGWVWARVGGDVLDLAMLGTALRSDSTERDRAGMATAAVVGVTIVDLLTSQQLSREKAGATETAIRTEKAVTVNRPPEEVYAFWHDFRNLPRFMRHLESVAVHEDGRSHWRAKAMGTIPLEWDARTIVDQPNELIAWRSLPDSDVANSGSVRFNRAPGNRGTEVRVEVHFDPPGGKIGATLAKLLGEAPELQLGADLHRFKQIIETGEVVYSDASIHRRSHPARPSEDIGE